MKLDHLSRLRELLEDRVAGYASARLGKYKVPSRWLITGDPLPRNATGKVIRLAAAALLYH